MARSQVRLRSTACRCPLSTLHRVGIDKPDNDFSRAKYSKELLDPKLNLTEEERRRLQEEIDQVLALEKLTESVPI